MFHSLTPAAWLLSTLIQAKHMHREVNVHLCGKASQKKDIGDGDTFAIGKKPLAVGEPEALSF